MTKRFLLYFVILFFIYFAPVGVFADTFVSGGIAENTSWNIAGSPYIVEGDVFVDPGITLSIDSGVEVLFLDYTNLYVYGNLKTLGVLNSKTLFESSPDGSGFWNIYVESGGEINLSHTNIRNVRGIYLYNSLGNFESVNILSEKGLGISGGGFLSFFGGSVSANSGSALGLFSSESFISDVSIETNYDSNQVEIYDNSKIHGFNTTFELGLSGGIGIFDSSAEFSNSNFLGGLDSAVEIYSSDPETYTSSLSISSAYIHDYLGSAVQVYDSDVSIKDSDFFDNEEAFFFVPSYGGSFKITNSNIYDNTVGAEFYPEVGFENSFDAKNDWWGDVSGPYHENNIDGLGDALFGSIQYEPWLLKKAGEEVVCCSSVLFLPGLEASRLYTKGILENQLWEPNINSDVKKLYLNSDGTSIDNSIYTRDIIKRTNIGFGVKDENIYKNFSEYMDLLVLGGTIKNWEVFPYDWRFDYSDIINNGVKLEDKTVYIIPQLEKMASFSETGKVTIITHSNGGLFAKVLIDELVKKGEANLVDKLIMVAPPQLGTPESIGGLLHGDEQDLQIVLNKSVARGLGENMQSAYNLLPSKKYFDTVLDPVIEFDSSVDLVNNFRTKYGDTISSYQNLIDFLEAIKDSRAKPAFSDIINPNVLRTSFIQKSDNLHTGIDSWAPPIGIDLIQIAGWGVNTTKGYKYFAREQCEIEFYGCTFVLDHELVKTIDGDETVLTPSAVSNGGDKHYVNINDYNRASGDNITHKSILEITYLEDFIKNIIQNQNADLPQYITTEKPIDPKNKNLTISMHSPVAIDAYDSLGNHTGLVKNPNPNSDIDLIEAKIPNSSYEEVGEGKYIYINGEASTTIKLQGLDIGTFTLNIKSSEGEQVISESTFVDIPTNANMEGELIVGSSTPKLVLDIEGDGKNDIVLEANQEIDPIFYLNIIRKTVEGFDINKKVKENFLKRIDSIIKSVKKDKTKNALKKIKVWSKNLKSISKHSQQKNNYRKISKEDSQVLLKLLNQLLNILEK